MMGVEVAPALKVELEPEEEEAGTVAVVAAAVAAPPAAAAATLPRRIASSACLLTLCGAKVRTTGLRTADASSSRTTDRISGWLKSERSSTDAATPSATRRSTA